MGTNTKVKESFVKYLAGVIDADGSLSFKFTKYKNYYYCSLIIEIQQSAAIDLKFRMLNHIKDNLLGMGSLSYSDRFLPEGAKVGRYRIVHRSSLNKIIPRLCKHLVIKGKHFKRLFIIWRGFKGKHLTLRQVNRLKKYSKWSRTCSGSVKAKSHPTWAWLAGYLDGDGCFYVGKSRVRSMPIMTLSITTHKYDRAGIDLIQKAFKGWISTFKDKPYLYTWQRSLGKQHWSFIKRFLPKVLHYSIIKKHKIERILEIHNKFHKQRLSEKTCTQEATV